MTTGYNMRGILIGILCLPTFSCTADKEAESDGTTEEIEDNGVTDEGCSIDIPELSPLHVQGRHLYDALQRRVFLRGVNTGGRFV